MYFPNENDQKTRFADTLKYKILNVNLVNTLQ